MSLKVSLTAASAAKMQFKKFIALAVELGGWVAFQRAV
jgi:hypothetical protein